MIKKVILTRPSGPYSGARRLASKLESKGYDTRELPLLKCVPINITQNDRVKVLRMLQAFDCSWLVFLSPMAVWVWKDLIDEDADLLQSTAKSKIATQGSGTANAVKECFNRNPDFVPSVFVAEDFAREFIGVLQKGEWVVVPQSTDGRDVFVPWLAAAGFSVYGAGIYRLEANEISKDEISEYRRFVSSDTAIVFMSPSAASAASLVLGGVLGTDKIISVGPITSQAIKQAGLAVWREAKEHSEDGVLQVLDEARLHR